MTAIAGGAEYASGTTDDIVGIITHSDSRLEFRLREALLIYPALLTDAHAAIARLATDSVSGQERLYGTGPFELTSQTSTQIVLQRNADYWKGNPPRLDVVEFRPALNAAKVSAGLRSGEFDLARDLLPQDLNEVLRDPRFRRGLIESPKKNTYYALFNTATGAAAQNWFGKPWAVLRNPLHV
jgi:ABC-type transport system substrate-binding protein